MLWWKTEKVSKCFGKVEKWASGKVKDHFGKVEKWKSRVGFGKVEKWKSREVGKLLEVLEKWESRKVEKSLNMVEKSLRITDGVTRKFLRRMQRNITSDSLRRLETSQPSMIRIDYLWRLGWDIVAEAKGQIVSMRLRRWNPG